jgi:glycogen debranching enzyme
MTNTFDRLKEEAKRIGKPEWRPMLQYVAGLHERSTNPARSPFRLPWEGIGVGYCYGPAFGHWDIVHAMIDTLPQEREHVRNQLLNNFALQGVDGFQPGVVYMRGGEVRYSSEFSHPPVWPFAVLDYFALYGDDRELLELSYDAIARQIGWFEAQRKAEGTGFYYTDILSHRWESGVDDGIRFDQIAMGPYACVDASSHMYALYDFAAGWAEELGRSEESGRYRAKKQELENFLQQRLFDPETGWFHDIWAVGNPTQRPLCFEGVWPMVVGAATDEQARRVVEQNLLAPDRFFTNHPIPTVAACEPKFELRMWRGPAWNSMTYWAVRGCLRYGYKEAAGAIVERALDSSAKQFERTGTVWEFYDPFGGEQTAVQRKPYTEFNTPCRDYMGHNPLLAMTRLWEELQGKRAEY